MKHGGHGMTGPLRSSNWEKDEDIREGKQEAGLGILGFRRERCRYGGIENGCVHISIIIWLSKFPKHFGDEH